MSFSNETPDETDERRLRAVLRQAPIPATPLTLGHVLTNSLRRRWKVAATITSVAAGIVLGLFALRYWVPPQPVCVEKSPHITSPFDAPPIESLDLRTVDLSALEAIGKGEGK
jgi:hypothetical protein